MELDVIAALLFLVLDGNEGRLVTVCKNFRNEGYDEEADFLWEVLGNVQMMKEELS